MEKDSIEWEKIFLVKWEKSLYGMFCIHNGRRAVKNLYGACFCG